MKSLLALLVLLLPALARAGDTSINTLETYSLPTAIWLKIPTTMRDDPALLRTTLIGQLSRGKIRVEDRLGGTSLAGQTLRFDSQVEILAPFKFAISDTNLFPEQWKAQVAGSSLELDPLRGRSLNVSYSQVDPEPAMRTLLTAGNRLDITRATHPMFSRMLLETTLVAAKVSLAGIAPDPDRTEREKRLFLSFLVTSAPPVSEPGTKSEACYMVEVLGIRGSTRSAKIADAQLMKDLLRRSDAHAFSAGMSTVTGRRGSLEAIHEYPFPGRAEKGPGGTVPTDVAKTEVGTILSVHVTPAVEGKVAVTIQVNHDFSNPVFPVVPGKGEELMEGELLTYTMQLRARGEVELGSWTLLTAEPLSKVFDPKDRKFRGESCYLFARVVETKE